MMSSVVPARLEFQCGHAALVSLPRVKGESSAQRSARIAREKSAAQARSCDFCPPPLALVEPEPVALVVVEPEPVVLIAAEPEPDAPIAAEPEPVHPVAASTDAPTRSSTRLGRPRRSVVAPRNGHPPRHQFVVRFRMQAVLDATDIRDALRQAERLGAAELLGLSVLG